MATTLNVQFSDSSDTTIVAWFASPQPDMPNMGTVSSSDPRWLAYYDSFPPDWQKFLPAPTTD
ncbi:conserved protein of unknown function [Pararobbsia alpina]